jgi:hypothetical protein
MTITLNDATQLAQLRLDEISAQVEKELSLSREVRLDRERFWAYPYNTLAFAKSQDPRDGLVGNGPILVDKETSAVLLVPTGGMMQWLEHHNTTGRGPEKK